MPPVLVLAAMKRELSALLAPGIRPEHSFGTWTFYSTKILGKDVVLGVIGIGKVLSALGTNYALSRYMPKAVFLTGIAGSLSPDLMVGDIIVAEDTLQWDLDCTGSGWKRGEIPLAGIGSLACDRALFEAACSYTPPPGRKLAAGRVLSGDTFIREAGSTGYSFLREELNGSAADMEGASAALAAYLLGVPFLLFRIISDSGNGVMPVNFKAFLSEASEVSAGLIKHLLKGLSRE